MKKIAEMTHEELQDYALELEQTVATKDSQIAEKDGKITELGDLNKTLQKRNNDLFMKVSQGNPNEGKDGEPTPEQPPKSCEEYAKDLSKEIIK